MNGMQSLLNFLSRLEEAELPYTLEHNSDSTLLVLVAVEGERWEVEFSADGEMQVEVFYSGETAEGEEADETVERLFLDLDDDEEDEDEDWEEEDLDEELEEDEEDSPRA